MVIGRAGLAVGTEIEIVTHSTLVADASDVGGYGIRGTAQGSIAADAHVHRLGEKRGVKIRKGLINSCESVVWVHEVSVLGTLGAVIPVGAVEALVTDPSDVLCGFQSLESNSCKTQCFVRVTYSIASITDGVVDLVSARIHLDSYVSRHLSAWHCSCEGVLGVVAVGILGEAWLAEVIILTISAVKKLALRQFCVMLSVSRIISPEGGLQQEQSQEQDKVDGNSPRTHWLHVRIFPTAANRAIARWVTGFASLVQKYSAGGRVCFSNSSGRTISFSESSTLAASSLGAALATSLSLGAMVSVVLLTIWPLFMIRLISQWSSL